jgi:hypothetical protein
MPNGEHRRHGGIMLRTAIDEGCLNAAGTGYYSFYQDD